MFSMDYTAPPTRYWYAPTFPQYPRSSFPCSSPRISWAATRSASCARAVAGWPAALGALLGLAAGHLASRGFERRLGGYTEDTLTAFRLEMHVTEHPDVPVDWETLLAEHAARRERNAEAAASARVAGPDEAAGAPEASD